MTEGTAAERGDLAAGDFSSWLRSFRNSLHNESGMDVPCGNCIGCCSSHQFIHVRPEETRTLARIPNNILVAAPGLLKGHLLMGYDRKGFCPMMKQGRCRIYEDRPVTCRIYDCRAFAAAGIMPCDPAKAVITERAKRWRFSYPTDRARDEHKAVQTAARFIQEHAGCFPGGKIPNDPAQLAVLAIKAYGVFFKDGAREEDARASSDADTASAIVEACRAFDARTPNSVSDCS